MVHDNIVDGHIGQISADVDPGRGTRSGIRSFENVPLPVTTGAGSVARESHIEGISSRVARFGANRGDITSGQRGVVDFGKGPEVGLPHSTVAGSGEDEGRARR